MRKVPSNRTLRDSIFFVSTNLSEENLLADPRYAQLVLSALEFYRKRGDIQLFGFVTMPDHIHLLARINEPLTLSRFMNNLKSFVSHKIDKGPIWQKDYWSELITTEHHFIEKLNYIHANPVKAGLSETPEAYKWSSASDYLNGNLGDRIDRIEETTTGDGGG
jgi:REP element-mobilizing transposase RayT